MCPAGADTAVCMALSVLLRMFWDDSQLNSSACQHQRCHGQTCRHAEPSAAGSWRQHTCQASPAWSAQSTKKDALHNPAGPARTSRAFRHSAEAGPSARNNQEAAKISTCALSATAPSGEAYTFEASMMDVKAEALGHSKQELRRRLAFLSFCYPPARPSQGMLKQVRPVSIHQVTYKW